ncbi:MAG: cob(I)yrinic acid a,c-diamide adenosyltransferase [Trueperaceae bacterium]|nr:cob(I)yrinic acid a,c-diamide adenosyltransferase [Trueperaceae bacterium]
MKIYTRTGDVGETSLFGGERTPKHAARVRAYGTVDEANAHLGMARAHVDDVELDVRLARLQNALFDLGADLATPEDSPLRARLALLDADDVAELEAWIDEAEADLEPLRQFILPGGHQGSAALQVARAVVRRAERDVALLAEEATLNPHVLAYLNRLSDLLFVLARAVNARHGVSESRWRVASRLRRA